MDKLFQSYLDHLSKNPELVSMNIKWTICTFMVWIVLFAYRKSIVIGLEGENKLFEAGEIINFVIIWMLPPILSHAAFYKDIPVYEWTFLGLIIAYAIGGRWIFDWALSVYTKNPKIVDELKTKTTTTTETTLKKDA